MNQSVITLNRRKAVIWKKFLVAWCFAEHFWFFTLYFFWAWAFLCLCCSEYHRWTLKASTFPTKGTSKYTNTSTLPLFISLTHTHTHTHTKTESTPLNISTSFYYVQLFILIVKCSGNELSPNLIHCLLKATLSPKFN